MAHHLILVRERDEQMSGSGCCGRLEGDLTAWDESGSVFEERRERMLAVGVLYRAVRERFGDQVEITMIDPRNQVALVPLIVRDAFRYGVRPREVFRALAASSLSTGIFDGELVFSREVPSADELIALLARRVEPEVDEREWEGSGIR